MSLVLQTGSLSFNRDGHAVLEDVSLTCHAGEVHGVVGPNGAGKTTLLRLLAGLERAHGGRLSIAGREASTLDPRERARLVGYHAQNPGLHWPLSVADVVALGRLPHRGPYGRAHQRDQQAVATALKRCGLEAMATRHADQLSGGEQARVHLARLFAGEHPILLVDEPIANLDPNYQLSVLDLLGQHAVREPAHGVVVVLHDLALAARYCDRITVLDQGRVWASGAPREVLTDEALARVFHVPPAYAELSGLAAARDACS